MDQREFVRLLNAVVLEGLSSDVVSAWQHPPGRLRSEEKSRRSDWLETMNSEERALLEAFGADVARAAVFGVLAVLDGNRKVEEPEIGHLELRHVSHGRSELLASSAMEMPVLPLHELLP